MKSIRGSGGTAPTVGWRLAAGFRQRLLGLLASPPPPAGTALLIAPCRAVHTVGMRYPIDIVFLSRDGRVVRICRQVAPMRVRVSLAAWAVAEFAPGEARRLGIVPGMRLKLPGCFCPGRQLTARSCRR